MKRRSEHQRRVLLALTLLAVLLLGCGQTSYSGGVSVSITPTLPGVAGAYLEAERAAGERERAEAQATAQAANAVLTVQAAEVAENAAQAMLEAQAAATAQAIDARATVQALDAQATAQAMALEMTRTAEAEHRTATAVAGQATATVGARNATATARADRLTATAEVRHSGLTLTADAHHWQQTVSAGQVTDTAEARRQAREEMELRRQRLTHPLRTYGPWVLMVVGVVGALYALWRLSIVLEIKGRALKRDARGDAPIYAVGTGRALTLYDPDRNFWGGATIIDGRVIEVHETAPTPELQARLVAGDQAVDLMTRGSLGNGGQATKRQRTRAAKRLAAPSSQWQGGAPGLRGVRVVRNVGQATRAGVIPPALAGHVEKDWIEGEWEEV